MTNSAFSTIKIMTIDEVFSLLFTTPVMDVTEEAQMVLGDITKSGLDPLLLVTIEYHNSITISNIDIYKFTELIL